ncbi:DNA repair protein RecO [Lacisediminimonas sp.]|uniref:DNA repair protein RecO n=1 Tax=Lacisediminimonas sp. TaxID=3060582 RepID=UPI002716A750|nr:DNA repair protein RecO [Lacisediminimonas sp.]MDO8301380.1 DNA repair protein RecO [Lacisediminimonas sp.]
MIDTMSRDQRDPSPVVDASAAVAPGVPASTAPASSPPASDSAPSSAATPSPAVSPATASPVRSAPAPRRELRIVGQPGFVLHSYPYKETSLIIDLFSREHGRVALIAKGAKRPHSRLRGVLQTFQPLSVGWSGKSEVRTLTAAEWVGGMLPLEKSGLLCGFYLNELLVRMIAREDPHPHLFDHYVATLNQLAHNEPAPIVLRKFELALLKETGVAAELTVSARSARAVQPDEAYVVDPEHGVREARAGEPAHVPVVAGKTLLDMDRQDYSDNVTQAQSKLLLRFLLAHHLGGAPLSTRQILIDLTQL